MLYQVNVVGGVGSVSFCERTHFVGSFTFSFLGDGVNHAFRANLESLIKSALPEATDLDGLTYAFSLANPNISSVESNGNGEFTFIFPAGSAPTAGFSSSVTVTVSN
jgi:hypothetical protein